MNITCIICSDTLLPHSEVYATLCGHVFHYPCLLQWIERSKTCPQCRNQVTQKSIYRIFFNQANTDNIVDDVATLQNKIDNYQFQMTLKEKDVKIANEKYKKTKDQNMLLSKEIAKLDSINKGHVSEINGLKETISYFKKQLKERDRLVEEITKMKAKLKEMKLAQVAVNGTREEVNELLKNENDLGSLIILAASLKKALVDTENKKLNVEHKFKQLQNNVLKYRKEICSLESSNEELKKEIELLKLSWKQEKEYLTNMVLDAHKDTSDKNTSVIKRILSESPVPLPQKSSKNCTENSASNTMESPSLEEKVLSILNSDSPYMPVQTSSVGINQESLKNRVHDSTQKMSIFKKPIDQPRRLSLCKSDDIVYNGLGGQSKEDIFPSARISFASGRKHKANTTSLSSAKFRKLNPFHKNPF